MAMTRGQESLMMDLVETHHATGENAANTRTSPLKVLLADAEELEAHQQYLEGLAKGGNCVWQR
jgi:DNA polymerase III subunit epsilon